MMTKTMKKTAFSFSMLLLAGSLLVVPASADTINLALTTSTQTGGPGSTLTFDATVSAPSANGAAVFLNSDSFGVNIAGSTIDDSGFLFNFPFSLNPGDDFTGTLFTVALPANLAPGNYNGFFEILGGSSGGAQDSLATVDFQINTVPEPGTWVLLATGLSTLATWILGRRYLSQAKSLDRCLADVETVSKLSQ
jgi:hypothetical protein